ncbi:hypothetical protein I7I51_02311, partial [Histoplasma capsulatum]
MPSSPGHSPSGLNLFYPERPVPSRARPSSHYLAESGKDLSVSVDSMMEDTPAFKQEALVRGGYGQGEGGRSRMRGVMPTMRRIIMTTECDMSLRYKVYLFDRYNWDDSKKKKIRFGWGGGAKPCRDWPSAQLGQRAGIQDSREQHVLGSY